MTCIHWRELDDDFGNTYEYCKAMRKKCVCIGEKFQCSDVRFFNASTDTVVKLRKEVASERTLAAVEPFLQCQQSNRG